MKPFTTSPYIYDLSYRITRGTSLQVHISDLHFGVIDPKLEFTILKEQFIDKIKDLPLDCISIDGDFFDRLFNTNTDATLYANLFFRELYNICKRNNIEKNIHTVLLLLLGTKNHDADQLRLFYPYLDDKDVDIRIVESMRFEMINGCKVLCIPELYGISEEEYFEVLYNSGYYDMIFMHGTIKGSVYNDQTRSKVFDDSDFGFCNGPVIAGHVHPGGSFLGYCYYNGSPIRWNFGEEQPKGFQLVLYDMDTRKYYIHKEIITSFRYDTLSVDDIIMSDPHQVISYINDLRDKEGIDYIRLKCFSNQDNQQNINILKDYYKTDKTVKFLIEKESSISSKTSIQQTQDLYDKYSYFFDKSMSHYQILAKFINDSEGSIVVSADQIIEALKEI